MSTNPAHRPAGRIIVGVDGSPSSEEALRWAAGQARLTGQEFHAVITWQVPVAHEGWGVGEFDWAGHATETLQKSAANVLGQPGAPEVVQHVIRGHPAKVLTEAVGDADLLVVGSRGHGGFAGLVVGSVSQHLVAHAPCPVVVHHGHRAPVGRIVVGVDGSPESQQALRWAAEQARLAGSTLRAVLAWQLPVGYGLADLPAPDWSAHASQTLATAVAAACDKDDAATVEQEVVEGETAEMLLRRALDADLLVVGSRGRGGFSGLLLGSVSQHAAAHAPCPVVVHHGATSQPGESR